MNPRLITVISLFGLFIAGFAISGWISFIIFIVLVCILIGWFNQHRQKVWAQRWQAMSPAQRRAYNAQREQEEAELQEQMLWDDDDDMAHHRG